MEHFKDNNPTFQINHNSTIKDYFDGLAFFEERYLKNVRGLFIDCAIFVGMGMFCCLMIILLYFFTDTSFLETLSCILGVIAFLFALLIIYFLWLTKKEKKLCEYSVKQLGYRLQDDGVTLNQEEIQTDVNLKNAFRKYKKEMYLSTAVIIAYFIFLTVAFFVFGLN